MTTGKNRKKVLIVGRMPQAGIDVLKKRDDVDYEILTDDTVPSLHPKLKEANAVTLGATPFRQAELDVAPEVAHGETPPRSMPLRRRDVAFGSCS